MSENGLTMSDSQDDTIELDPNSIEYLSQDADNSGLSLENTSTLGGGNELYSERDRPYVCHVCNKRFIQKAHLIIHKRIHTGEKPYSCHICNKRFAQSSHLAVHKRVHTGEKPFFCNFCGMGFCRRPRLEAHILQHMVKEGRNFLGDFKGTNVSNLSMVGFGNSGPYKVEMVNQESLDAAAQLMELKMKGGLLSEIKAEPQDAVQDELMNSVIPETNGISHSGENDGVRKRRKPEFVRRLGGKDVESSNNVDKETDLGNDKSGHETGHSDYANTNLLDLSSEELDKFTSSLTELNDFQKQVLNHSLMIGSSKNHQISNFINNVAGNNSLHSTSSMVNSGLTMSGLVRTNNRVSLVDFTAEDILKHLMTRDDVKSCDFCCIVFHDPAMYYLHRSMHDKMDVRCCNLCGKLLTDKYDFTAHFLSQHK
ncbi:unnamed protein product [Candidula unifasciata]|uniref:C2H2-type domain-containing protein n=1 Tax=Candidula unifasciata TaxID=100452 RepID=A0A8S3ZJ51_9EUPU|nr:unnamed protein product [Candidula unifasciata]